MRYYDENGSPTFKSLGKFRIARLDVYHAFYYSKFIYPASGDRETIYDGLREFMFDGVLVMTLVYGTRAPVTLIPKECLVEIK